MHGKVVVCLSVSSAFGKMTIRQQIRRELDVVALTKKTRWKKTGGSDAARVGFRAGGWGLRRKWRGGGCGVPAEPQDMHSTEYEHMGSFLEASHRTPFGG